MSAHRPWPVFAGLLLAACQTPIAIPGGETRSAWYSDRETQVFDLAPADGAEHEQPAELWERAGAELVKDARSRALLCRLLGGGSVALQILDRHAGDERFRDPPPTGSTFIVRLRGDELAVEERPGGGLRLRQRFEIGVAVRGDRLDVVDRISPPPEDEALARIGRLSAASQALIRLLLEDLLERRLERWVVADQAGTSRAEHRARLDARIEATSARYRWVTD